MRFAPLLALTLAGCPEGIEEPLSEGETLADAITQDALMDHLGALQDIADANDGNRMFLSGGYDSSVDYIVTALEDAGYTVRIEPFEISAFTVNGARVTDITAGSVDIPATVFQFSGSGDVSADITPVDVVIPPGGSNNTTDSGCETSDFDGFPVGNIALIQRGTCTFTTKAANAQAAGASAVLIFNEGQQGRRDAVEGQLDAGVINIPVMGLSYGSGRDLIDAGAASARVQVDAEVQVDEDVNLFASTEGDPQRAILVGAHLDGVQAGAGINDNGSGSAFLLELALQMAQGDIAPANQVQFAWWGAEEEGLLGSAAYFFDDFGERNDANLDGVDAYLNFDMLASGNGVRMIYDGDASDFNDGVDNDGSALIEDLFEAHFAERGLQTGSEALLIPSDSYWPAILGMPTGGLFSGAFGVKTNAEEDAVGGDDGVAYDPCYHLRCDTLDNTNPQLFTELAKAGADVIEQLAQREEPFPAGGRRRAVPAQQFAKPRGCHDHAAWDR